MCTHGEKGERSDKKVRDDKKWSRGDGGSELRAHVAAITLRGESVREPLQKPA